MSKEQTLKRSETLIPDRQPDSSPDQNSEDERDLMDQFNGDAEQLDPTGSDFDDDFADEVRDQNNAAKTPPKKQCKLAIIQLFANL